MPARFVQRPQPRTPTDRGARRVYSVVRRRVGNGIPRANGRALCHAVAHLRVVLLPLGRGTNAQTTTKSESVHHGMSPSFSNSVVWSPFIQRTVSLSASADPYEPVCTSCTPVCARTRPTGSITALTPLFVLRTR